MVNLSPFYHQMAVIYHSLLRSIPDLLLESYDNHRGSGPNHPIPNRPNRPLIVRRLMETE